jgi:phage gp36-like protein
MYITVSNLYTRMSEQDVIRLSNDDYAATAIDTEVVNEIIDTAEDMLNSFVRGRYIVPLTPVTKLIESMVLDLAVHGLYSRRTNIPIPEPVSDAYKNTIKLLGLIQERKMHIGVSEIQSGTSGAISGGVDIRMNKTPADRLFSKDNLGKY